ncbi:MAG: hypothetical protein JSW49_04425 [candidate division WOR-3 bacterium]|nr:MAG: hypothetical protein JSW49_04425 [candidate division WOR-3 bacterium]
MTTKYWYSFLVRRCSTVAVVILLLESCSEIEIKWTRDVDALGPGNYLVNSVSAMKDEIYIIGTYWQDKKDSRCFAAKYDADGSPDWFSVFESPGIRQAAGIQIVASMTSAEPLEARSKVYVLVQTGDTNGHQSVVLATYDTLGNVHWQNTVISSEGTLHAALLSDHVGNLYVAGWERDVEDRPSIYIGKYNESGDVVWFTKYYNEEINFTDLRCDMMQSNYLVLAGVLKPSGELFSMKYDGSGQFMGYTIHEGLKVSELCGVKIDPQGYVYITASISDPENGEDYLTVVYDESNNLQWMSQYDGAAHRDDKPKAIAIDEALSVYVAGTSEDAQGMTVITVVKYDSTGSPVWVANPPQKEAADLLFLEPRYIPKGRYDDARYFHVAGTTGCKAILARCNLEGVFSWSEEYGQNRTMTEPTAISGHVLAFQSIEDGISRASISKFGPSTIMGLARWD